MKNNMAILKRDSTKLTISEFYERYKLGKYNFEPSYQRRGDVWDTEKQSFLIDSILKNYPIPPIFLHQRIDDETGFTKYDVIDGKQRLTAITKFLNGDISLPKDFSDDLFGDPSLNGAFFKDLDSEIGGEYKKQLWRYTVSVEYIDSDDEIIIDNIFDRLNRNGESLVFQELRKAQYHDTELMRLIEDATKVFNWDNLDKIKFNRMQDQEFISELIFVLLNREVGSGDSRKDLDNQYEEWNKKLDGEMANKCLQQFKEVSEYLENIDLDFNQYSIRGVSHFYALFVFAWNCVINDRDLEETSQRLNDFYAELRNGNDNNDDVINYNASMQSNTRAKSQRIKRINALIHYCFGE